MGSMWAGYCEDARVVLEDATWWRPHVSEGGVWMLGLRDQCFGRGILQRRGKERE